MVTFLNPVHHTQYHSPYPCLAIEMYLFILLIHQSMFIVYCWFINQFFIVYHFFWLMRYAPFIFMILQSNVYCLLFIYQSNVYWCLLMFIDIYWCLVILYVMELPKRLCFRNTELFHILRIYHADSMVISGIEHLPHLGPG